MPGFDYSKFDHIGEEEDEQETEDREHRRGIYRCLQKINQELIDYASAGQPELVEQVLDRGAFINCKLPQNGNTPLHICIWTQHASVTEVLVRRGADLEVKDSDGCRPLHTAAWAAFEGCVRSARLLLERGVEICPRNKSGDTPLHLGAGSSLEMTVLLLEAGADPLAVNNAGLTPRQLSEQRKGGTMKRKSWYAVLRELEQAEERCAGGAPGGAPPALRATCWRERAAERAERRQQPAPAADGAEQPHRLPQDPVDVETDDDLPPSTEEGCAVEGP